MQKILGIILSDWDDMRRKHRQTGDSENPSITKKERKAEELFNEVSDEYETDEDPDHPEQKEKVESWVNELLNDARFNFPSYADCFISENLIRKHIEDQGIVLSKEAKREIKKMKQREQINKDRGNLSIDIRKSSYDTSYLSMDQLANLVDKLDENKKASLSRDAHEYKPIRDAVAHTALITDPAKAKLTSVFENIKGRVRTLLS
jgi:hypothetical protein